MAGILTIELAEEKKRGVVVVCCGENWQMVGLTVVATRSDALNKEALLSIYRVRRQEGTESALLSLSFFLSLSPRSAPMTLSASPLF